MAAVSTIISGLQRRTHLTVYGDGTPLTNVVSHSHDNAFVLWTYPGDIFRG